MTFPSFILPVLISFVGQASPQVRLLENPGNRGKGYSVRAGMMQANGQEAGAAQTE